MSLRQRSRAILRHSSAIGVAGYTALVVAILAFILPSNSLRAWGNISLVVMTVLVITFTAFYAARSPFWKNQIGWIFMAKSVFLSAVLIQVSLSVSTSSASVVVGYYPGRDYLRLAIYAGGAVAYAVMLAALIYMQRGDRAHHRPTLEDR